MGLDQKGTVILHVRQGKGKKWEVTEEGFENPLASFEELEQAKSYANQIADTKKGSEVIIDA